MCSSLTFSYVVSFSRPSTRKSLDPDAQRNRYFSVRRCPVCPQGLAVTRDHGLASTRTARFATVISGFISSAISPLGSHAGLPSVDGPALKGRYIGPVVGGSKPRVWYPSENIELRHPGASQRPRSDSRGASCLPLTRQEQFLGQQGASRAG